MRQAPALARTVVALAVILIVASKAEAGIKDGWWGSIDGYFAQPANLNLDAGVKFNANITDGGTVISVPYDHEYSTRLRGGWRDEASENNYSISWWAWDHGASITDRTLVIPTLSDPFFGNTLSAKVVSEAATKTRVIDLAMSRKITSTKKGSWFYAAGLRLASFRQDWNTDYSDIDPNTFTLFTEEKAQVGVFSSGAGITAGLGSVYQWSKRWRTSLRAQVAMLSGETDAEFIDKFIELDPNGGVNLLEAQLRRDGDKRVYQQLELEARVSYNVWKTLDINLGYNFFQWNDAMEVAHFADDVQSTPLFRRDNIAYQGATLGVTYWF